MTKLIFFFHVVSALNKYMLWHLFFTEVEHQDICSHSIKRGCHNHVEGEEKVKGWLQNNWFLSPDLTPGQTKSVSVFLDNIRIYLEKRTGSLRQNSYNKNKNVFLNDVRIGTMPGSGWPTQNKLKFIFEVFLKCFCCIKLFMKFCPLMDILFILLWFSIVCLHWISVLCVHNCVSAFIYVSWAFSLAIFFLLVSCFCSCHVYLLVFILFLFFFRCLFVF